jgi:putative PEP-CTERM system histidine kinase
MNGAAPHIGLWASFGGLLALAGFAALIIEALWRWHGRRPLSYIAALVATALWLGAEALWGWSDARTAMAETLRNLGWLWFMASIAGQRESGRRLSAVGFIYVGLFALNLLTGVVGLLATVGAADISPVALAMPPAKMLFVAGALVLLHNLYDSARVDERSALSLPIAAMAMMWGYDLNLYAIAYLSREPAALMESLRPVGALVLVLLLGMAALRPGARAVRLSRPVAFRSLALGGVAAWLLLLAAVASIASMLGSDFGWQAQVGVLGIGLIGSALLLVSPQIRAAMRVFVAKHFFEHRYDYRAEWLRFTSTLTRQGRGDAALEARIVKAIGDIVEATGGALLAEDADGRMTLAGGLPGHFADLPLDAEAGALTAWLGTNTRIVQFDEVRAGRATAGEVEAVPGWLLDHADAWVAVPLVHQDVARGIVLLARPVVDRALDWEDFDLLRVAGRQAASYLAEARGSEALVESKRFEEFHRRFAFVMHDVKNLASQLSLLSRNIERHGDNPEFREDMTATVKLAATRLQSLTARLAEQDRVRVQRVAAVDIAQIARQVVASKYSAHPVTLVGEDGLIAAADADLVERLLGHLVQNAIDASEGESPVVVMVEQQGRSALVHVTDEGVGMSTEFIRTGLFRPFVSTKDGGFGIGAFQARNFAEAMGGTLSVSSREGEGSRFTLALPLATAQLTSAQERAA